MNDPRVRVRAERVRAGDAVADSGETLRVFLPDGGGEGLAWRQDSHGAAHTYPSTCAGDGWLLCIACIKESSCIVDSGTKLNPDLARTLRLLSEALFEGAQLGSGACHWLSHLEANVLLLLRTTVRSEAPSAGKDAFRMDKMMAFIRQRMFAPIALEDLSRAAGLSSRGLSSLCQRFGGASPMAILRNCRLDAARQRLLQAPDANIAAIAMEHGFEHHGRFAAQYRERFGESPTATTRGADTSPA